LIAHGLYNHSPSFDWDVKFFKEATPFANTLADFAKEKIIANNLVGTSNLGAVQQIVRDFLNTQGSKVKGDHLTTDENINNVALHCLDFANGQEKWQSDLESHINVAGGSFFNS